MRRGFGQKAAPVNEGEEIDVEIEAVGEKGDGIAKKEGFVLFVPGAKQGDKVRIKVNRVLKNVGFAEVVGEAQGTPETEAAEPAQEEQQQEEEAGEAAEEAPQEQEEQQAEDSEDFGEELEEEKKE